MQRKLGYLVGAKKKNVKKHAGGKVKHQCCFVGCLHNNTTSKMQCVQAPVKQEKKPVYSSKLPLKRSFYCNFLLRKKKLERCGVSHDNGKQYRICKNHEKEKIIVLYEVEHKSKKVNLTYEMIVPKGVGVSNKMAAPCGKKQAMKEEIEKIYEMLDRSESAKIFGHDKFIKNLLNLEDHEEYGSLMKKIRLRVHV